MAKARSWRSWAAMAAAVTLTTAAPPLAAAPPDRGSSLDAMQDEALDRDLAAAEKRLTQQLATGGPTDTSYETTLGSISLLNAPPRRRKEVIDRFVRILEARLPPGSPRLARGLLALGNGPLALGMYDLAEPLLVRALAIFEKAQPPDTTMIDEVRRDLVDLYAASGKAAEAAAIQARLCEDERVHDDALFRAGTEEMKRGVLDRERHVVDQAVSLGARAFPRSPEAARLALATILAHKGHVLELLGKQLAAARGSSDAADRAAVERLAALDAQLAVRLTRGGAGAAEVTALRKEQETLQIRINATSWDKGHEDPVTVARVAAALPGDGALVEIFAYQEYVFARRVVDVRAGDGVPEITHTELGHAGKRRYAAYVLRPGGEIAGVDLGEVTAVDAAVKALRAALLDAHSDPKPAARALDALVTAKVRPLLGGARRLFVSPDGALALVPFGAFVDEDGRYLLERTSFTYLTGGRDLVRPPRAPDPAGRVVIFADPDFGPTRVAGGGRGVVDFAQLQFPPLAGTREEATRLAATVAGAQVIAGADATKAKLEATRRPLVLHLATHGFFWPADAAPPPRGAKAPRPEDSMLRAALAFAGANKPDQAGADGLLTALEASLLDLDGTALVVLSACSTGVGEASTGDGVYGLRRAFAMAGAEALVMSLWDVSDTATRDLMTAYYARLGKGEGRSEALRSVELSMLADPVLKHPFFWASFIASGSDAPVAIKLTAPSAAPAAPASTPAPGSATAQGCACNKGRAGNGGAVAAIGLAMMARLRRRVRRAR